MSLKIGFFSLQQGAGCTALSIHTANFLAGDKSHKVALIEMVATGREPEYQKIRADFASDGTCYINDVHIYPAEAKVEPDEEIQIYDLGQINFMFHFPEGFNKLYICTRGEPGNIEQIIRFKRNLDENQNGRDIKFDIILFGASKEQFNIFKQHPGLSFVSTVIIVPDKKEDRLDPNFAIRIQNVFRISGCGFAPPQYDPAMVYEPVLFYTKDEYKKVQAGTPVAKPVVKPKPAPSNPLPAASDIPRKHMVPEKKPEKTEPLKKPALVENGHSSLIAPDPVLSFKEPESVPVPSVPTPAVPKPPVSAPSIFDPGMLSFPDFEDVPAPSEKSADTPKPAEAEKTAGGIAEKKIEPLMPEKEHHIEPQRRISSDVPKAQILYRSDGLSAPGVLGVAADAVRANENDCCSLFVVTVPPEKLFVFTDMGVFYEKIGILQREAGSVDGIRYIVLTYKNGKAPDVFGSDPGNAYNKLRLLDADIRSGMPLDDEALKAHYELSVFDEVLYAS